MLQLAACNLKLLFIHGWATDSRVWQHQIKEFSKDYEVITVDLPCYSEKDTWSESTLKSAIDKVLLLTTHHSPLTGFIGIGWSLGAAILMQAAYLNPDLFKGLILIGATPKFVADETFPWGQPRGIAKRMLKDIKKDFSKTTERFYPLNFTKEELAGKEAKEFIEFYQKKGKGFSQKSVITALEALMSFDLRDALSDINIPALLIHGEKDNVCLVGAGKYLAKNLPDARLEIFKDAGHAPFLTRRVEFNAVVKKFLESIGYETN